MRLIALPLSLALAACTTTVLQSSNGSDAGAQPSAQGAPPLTCLGVLSCVTSQGCNDNPCVDACMAEGSTEAQQQVTDLATCYQNNSCQDSACLQANCKTELDACVSHSAPPSNGEPLGDAGAPPAGSVPADLVGTWVSMSGYAPGTEDQIVFAADGTATYSTAYSGGLGGCSNLQLVYDEGTVVVDATTITLYASKVTNTTQTCAGTTKTAGAPVTLSFEYTFDPGGPSLKLVDPKCAAEYAGYPTSIGLYCTTSYKKQ